MSLPRWKKLSERVVHSNPYWDYRQDRFELPTGKLGDYHYVHTRGSALIVPVREDGCLLLVNQYRYLADRESIEFPCGGIKSGATAEQTAHIELAEETGYSADVLVPVGSFAPYNGVADETCHVYIARELHRGAGATPDETEEFEIAWLTPTDLDEAVGSGEVWDGMTLAAWLLVKRRCREHLAP